jgi:HAD superfamily hydrolase (TIGR01549 family)
MEVLKLLLGLGADPPGGEQGIPAESQAHFRAVNGGGGSAVTRESSPRERQVAFLFDLDGTLVDSVYYHVIAWHQALARAGIALSVWRIHRRIGMSGGLFVNALMRELGHRPTPAQIRAIQEDHTRIYLQFANQVQPLPGAPELLAALGTHDIPWAVATSGHLEAARTTLQRLAVPSRIPVVTRDDVARAKPDPDLFLAAAERLGVEIVDCVVVGDSVWDMLAARRARALGVGLLSGGYGREELERVGAYQVYEDPADLLRHLDEVGVRTLIAEV